MTDKELFDLCRKYGSEALKWRRKFAALLPEVEKRKLWRKKGFYSIYDFGKRVGGISEIVVDKVLFLDKKLSEKPLLKAEIEKQGWAKVEVAARIPVEEGKAVEMVQSLSKSTLQVYAKEVIDMSEKGFKQKAGSELQPVTFKLDSQTHFQLKKFQQKLEKKKGRSIPLGLVLKELLELAPEGKIQGGSRIPVKQKRELYGKYKGKCAIKDCKNPANEFHHTKRFAKDGTHEGVVPLCHEHHQIAHAGLIENEQDDPKDWRPRKYMKPNAIDRKYLKNLKMANAL
ncbi:MAG: hypothetical protein ABII07_03950 [Patescibacteria group bacterium]|nr:hypothetical protein [Patescibacteria group bacterium]